jgi:hypothetical protein
LVFLGINANEFGGVDLDIGAHFLEVESALVVTLVLFIVPGKAVILCTVDKSPNPNDTKP